MIALMYHDVVPGGAEDSSGFRGRDAALYKVTPAVFTSHLEALEMCPAVCPAHPIITFDDGGASGLYAADELDRHGRRGYFFITANYIGMSGFLDVGALRELHARGHFIGSHSCSHPLRMARCGDRQLSLEWSASRTRLSDLLGADVVAASVPGGDYDERVGTAARDAGYTLLFTSEPTRRSTPLGSLHVNGRFTIRRGTSASAVAGLASGAWLPCARQAIAWAARKSAKRIGGSSYVRARKLMLRHGDEVRWGDQDAG